MKLNGKHEIMKNIFTSIFAAAALLAAFSCSRGELTGPDETTEIRENLVHMSFDASFATKADLDGLKTIWCSGDKIAVHDGVAFREFTLTKGEGTGKAIFEGEVVEGATSFFAVSPYEAAVSFAEGKAVVSLPAEQVVAQGASIDPRALIQVALADGDAFHLSNACSLVKFTVDADNIKSVILQVNNSEKIAGQASVGSDAVAICTGSSAIKVSPAEGVFTKGVTYYGLVFPATLTKGFKFFSEDDESLYLKQTQKANAFVRNGGLNIAGVTDKSTRLPILIKDAGDMKAFGENSVLYPASVTVALDADIDMSSVSADWAAADFAATFDGKGHALKNFTISGGALNTGVFGDLTGHIRNLTFGTQNGTESITATTPDGTACRVGCVAYMSGSATLTNVTNYAKVEYAGETKSPIYCGGVIGYSKSKGTIGACVNYGTVTATKPTFNDNAINLAGVAASVETACTVQNCENRGLVAFDASYHQHSLNEGGVIGFCNVGAKVDGCKNYGMVKITPNVNTNLKTLGYQGQRSMGGIMGYNLTTGATLTKCENHGEIYRNGGASEDHANCMGGIVGFAKTDTAISECTNDAKIWNDMTSSGRNLYMGGILGNNEATAAQVYGCTNSGQIVNNHTATLIHLGGIVGRSTVATKIGKQGSVCVNSGKVENTYQSSNGSSNATPNISMGGIIGYAGLSQIAWCSNSAEVKNTGNLNYGGNIVVLGGVAGTFAGAGKIDHCGNSGNIACKSGTSSKRSKMYLGGIVGYAMTAPIASMTSNENTCQSIVCEGYGSQSRVGGVMGTAIAAACSSFSDCNNSADITVKNLDDTYTYIGGILGDHPNSTTEGTIERCKNTGAVSIESTVYCANGLRVGGVVGCLSSVFEVKGCVNENAVSSSSPSFNVRLGGVLGSTTSQVNKCTECTNKGTVTVTALKDEKIVTTSSGTTTTSLNELLMGGLCAYVGTGTAFTDCSNEGDIVNTVAKTANMEYAMIGGVAGKHGNNTSYSGCVLKGEIASEGNQRNRIGAVVGYASVNPLSVDITLGPAKVCGIALTDSNYTNYLMGTASKATNVTGTTVKFSNN